MQHASGSRERGPEMLRGTPSTRAARPASRGRQRGRTATGRARAATRLAPPTHCATCNADDGRGAAGSASSLTAQRTAEGIRDRATDTTGWRCRERKTTQAGQAWEAYRESGTWSMGEPIYVRHHSEAAGTALPPSSAGFASLSTPDELDRMAKRQRLGRRRQTLMRELDRSIYSDDAGRHAGRLQPTHRRAGGQAASGGRPSSSIVRAALKLEAAAGWSRTASTG